MTRLDENSGIVMTRLDETWIGNPVLTIFSLDCAVPIFAGFLPASITSTSTTSIKQSLCYKVSASHVTVRYSNVKDKFDPPTRSKLTVILHNNNSTTTTTTWLYPSPSQPRPRPAAHLTWKVSLAPPYLLNLQSKCSPYIPSHLSRSDNLLNIQSLANGNTLNHNSELPERWSSRSGANSRNLPEKSTGIEFL